MHGTSGATPPIREKPDSGYKYIASSTGGSDRLMIIFDEKRIQLALCLFSGDLPVTSVISFSCKAPGRPAHRNVFERRSCST